MARKRKLGRKRKHPSDRVRMRRFRAKCRPKLDSAEYWNRHLIALGLGLDRGEVMTDAPSDAVGRMETGGFDLSTIEQIANHRR